MIAVVAVVVIIAAVAAGILLTKGKSSPSGEKVIDTYPSDDAFSNFDGTLICNVTEAKTVNKAVFDNMKSDKDVLIVNIIPASANGTTTTWTFSATDKQEGATKDVDLSLSVPSL